jgi:hypothetical protein
MRRGFVRQRLVLVAFVSVVGALLEGSPASGAERYVVTDVEVTPVLADYPYDPVLDGSTEFSDDPGDCSITGNEDHRLEGDGVYAATGCGGIKMRVVISGGESSPNALAYLSAKAKATYGCVHVKNGRTKRSFTRRGRVQGQDSGLEVPFLYDYPTTIGAYHLFPLESLKCKGKWTPAMLSITVTNFVVTIESYDGSQPDEVHAIAGTWSAALH